VQTRDRPAGEARLVEVGTTNRTRVADFAEVPTGAVRSSCASILELPPGGFTRRPIRRRSPPPRYGAILVDDLGSGALLDTSAFGLAHEPTGRRPRRGCRSRRVQRDKLLGGLSRLIVGRADLVRLRRDPLARAMRPDKATLAALAATLGLYRAGRATVEIPVWRMIAAPIDEVRGRAEAAVLGLVMAVPAEHRRSIKAVSLDATVGGGSLPGETIPSWGMSIRVGSADRLLGRLRLFRRLRLL
jgi:L-seryl-tRNA(Ser) seleniumtransferase